MPCRTSVLARSVAPVKSSAMAPSRIGIDPSFSQSSAAGAVTGRSSGL
jgi:hypothetical protein